MSIRALEWAWEQDVGGALLTLVGLAWRADEDGVCWPSAANLAELTRQNEKTVRRDLAALAKAKVITRERRHDRRGHRTSDRIRLVGLPDKMTGRSERNPDGVHAESVRTPGGLSEPSDGAPSGQSVPRLADILTVPSGQNVRASTKSVDKSEGISQLRLPAPGGAGAADHEDRIEDKIHDAVIRTVRERTGVEVDRGHAREVAELLLDCKDGVRNPVGYVIAAIRKEPDPRIRFLPNRHPSSVRINGPWWCRDHGQQQPCPVCVDAVVQAAGTGKL